MFVIKTSKYQIPSFYSGGIHLFVWTTCQATKFPSFAFAEKYVKKVELLRPDLKGHLKIQSENL